MAGISGLCRGRRAAKAGKGRERPGIEWGELSGLGRGCLAERSAGAELDAALAAVAWATEDEG